MLLSEFKRVNGYNEPKDYTSKQKKALRAKGFKVGETSGILDMSNVQMPMEKRLRIRALNQRAAKKLKAVSLEKPSKAKGMTRQITEKDYSPYLPERFKKTKATYQVLTPQSPTPTTVVPTASTGKVPANVSTSTIPNTNTNPGPSSSTPNPSKSPKKVKPKRIPYRKLGLLAGVSLAGGVGYAAYKKRKERSDKGKKRGRYNIF